MRQRKYTLPRHTNLAKQGSRIGAFLIDLAIFAAITMVFYFGCFNLALKGMVSKPESDLHAEQINSNLRYYNDKGEITQLNSEATFEQFRDTIAYYYLNYLPNVNIKEGCAPERTWEEPIDVNGTKVAKKDYYTVSWYNSEILDIKVDDPDNSSSCKFTYVKNADGTYDKSQIGVPKDPSIVPSNEISATMQQKFVGAFNHFQSLKFVLDTTNTINFIYTLELVLSSIIGGIITYIVIPILIKKGRTAGKRAFGLALANSDGYAFNNKQLLMRFMPALVCILAMLVPVWNDIFFIFLVYLIIFLVSFALAMASPKKSSLHDFTAQTIVVDDKSSIIFDNEAEEEMYLLEEDNMEPPSPDEGEEPELKYEK